MTNRQKRLCRALLDFYDSSGAQPYPLAQLARKTGCDASDIYDKDSESGDLWPFDGRARGNYSGLLSFTGGKNPTVNITSAGLVTLEKLMGDERPAPAPIKPPETPKRISRLSAPPVAAVPAEVPVVKPARVSAKPFPAPRPVISLPRNFTSDDVSDARARFAEWLESDPAGSLLIVSFEGSQLIKAAFEKFFSEFLKAKDS
jgi:hypothetical protein